MYARRALLATLLTLCCSGALGILALVSHAAEGTDDAGTSASRALRACNVPTTTQRQPGIDIQRFASTETTGGLAVLPDRVITGIEPGERGELCVGFHNRTGGTINLQLDKRDLGLTRDGGPVPVEEGLGEYGAAAWLTLPTEDPIQLAHGELAWITVQVAVPEDTSGGSNYAAITGTTGAGGDGGGGNAQVQLVPALAAHVYFDVAGDHVTSGKITDVRSPRVIWWDGAGIGDLPVLDSLRGRGSAPIRAEWTNTGSLTQRVAPRVDITSSLGGRRVARLTDRQRFVLRGGREKLQVTWKRDIPIVGRFTPTLHVEVDGGRTITKELPAIWVIPAWWYLALLAGAIAIPVGMRRRSKRRYADLVARLEAAERREVSVHSDADWDSEDAWSERD